MDKSRILMVGTPSGRRNLYYDFVRKHFPQVEIIYKKIENKINGNKISFIAYDEIECTNNKNKNTPACSEFKKKGRGRYAKGCRH